MKTQHERIIDYMNTVGEITPWEAMRDLGVMALSQRIGDLKRRGYPVGDTWRSYNGRYGKVRHKVYWLRKEP